MALSSPLFTHEREEKAGRRQAITLFKKVCCPVSRRLSVMLEQGDLFLISLTHYFKRQKSVARLRKKMSKSGFFWNHKKEQILADCGAEIQHSTQLRGENWSKIEILSLISQPRFRNYRMKWIVRMIRKIFWRCCICQYHTSLVWQNVESMFGRRRRK